MTRLQSNKSKTQAISITVGLAFCFLGFLLDKTFPNVMSALDSVYIGLFAYIISLLSIFNSHLEKLFKIEHIIKKTDRILLHFGISDSTSAGYQSKIDSFWNLCMVMARNNIYTFKSPDIIEIPYEERMSFWQQAIINTEQNWRCTNEVSIFNSIDSEAIKNGFKYQNIVSSINTATVSRVFLLHDEKEYNAALIEELNRKESTPTNSKALLKSNIKSINPLKEIQKLIGTTDFAIIDGAYVIAFILDDDTTRDIKQIHFHKNDRLVHSVATQFNLLWSASSTPTEVKLEPDENTDKDINSKPELA